MTSLTKSDFAAVALRAARRAVEAIADGRAGPVTVGPLGRCQRRLHARDAVRKIDEALDALAVLPADELERWKARALRAEAIVQGVLREAEPEQDVREVFAASAGWAYLIVESDPALEDPHWRD